MARVGQNAFNQFIPIFPVYIKICSTLFDEAQRRGREYNSILDLLN
jgi:hypothetical protein